MTNTRATILARVDKAGDCWVWLGSHTSDNRPQVNYEARGWYVYRLLWTWKNGPIPEAMTLDHVRCDNGWCCNPDHCVLATNSQNVSRGNFVRFSGDECGNGHPKALYFKRYANGRTQCAECNRIKLRARYWAAKAKR